MNDGVVHKKLSIFLKRTKKRQTISLSNDPGRLKKHRVFFYTERTIFSNRLFKNDLLNEPFKLTKDFTERSFSKKTNEIGGK